MNIKIKDITIEIINGDLITTPADVFVCPLNTKLNMAYGIAKILAEHGGETYVAEIKAKRNPELGAIFTTRAGELKTKYVFNAIVEDENHDVPRENIAKIMHQCFRLVTAMNLPCIAIPMLGSPRSKVPYDTFSRLMMRSTFEYFTDSANQKNRLHVKFVLFNKELFNSFCDQVNILRQEFFI